MNWLNEKENWKIVKILGKRKSQKKEKEKVTIKFTEFKESESKERRRDGINEKYE